MNQNPDRTHVQVRQQNPFWVCFLVFALLGADYGYRVVKLVQQRIQLGQAQLNQAQNIGRMSDMLAQRTQVETRLQAFSVDLVRVARTNTAAAQIVREFNIQWNPGPEALPVPDITPLIAAPQTNSLKAVTNAPSRVKP